MPTLLLRLAGPMQSWGTTSRFTERDTWKEPSKSGVIGLLAAAMGIDRENWHDLKPLTLLSMGVRHDRSGTLKRDFQTAGCSDACLIIKADGTQAKEGVVSMRFFLADAVFLVGLQGNDAIVLERAHAKLRDPVWPLSLGRKSYVPSEPVWIEEGLQEGPLREVLMSWPWLGSVRKGEITPESILVSLESGKGSGAMVMDQPLSSFAERRFGSRFVKSEWIPCPKGKSHAPA